MHRFFDAAESNHQDLQVPLLLGERISQLIEEKYHFPEKDNFIAKEKDITHMSDLSYRREKMI